MCLGSVFAGVPAAAASSLPPANDETRHTVCHALSAQAQTYYSGNHSYDALRALSGASDNTDSAAAMRNNALFDALHALMADTHTFYSTYSGYQEGSLAYYWTVTDSVAGSNTYVMFYSDLSPSDEGVRLNREHIWPKSRASYATSFGGADLHHLRPSAESVNMAKSDHMFGYIDGTYSAGYDAGEIGGSTLYWLMEPDDLFECKDDVKGDVARILLYVYCRWLQPNLYSDVVPENLPAMDEDDTANNGKRVIESLDTLLLWCALDPVDTWEMEQNDRIQEIQGNRNVFIDYPALAWQLFGLSAPNGMTTPTKAGCTHVWKETSRHETCAGDGAFTLSCSVCGDVYSRRLVPLAHTDADDNEYCDVCEQPLAVFADLKPVTALGDGTHFAVWHSASGLTVGSRATEDHKLETSAAHPHGSVLHPRDDSAVFTARQTEGGWYFLCDGKYLASAKTGTRLYWNAEPNDYSIWNLELTGTDDLVYIVNLNAAYYGKKQALEYYNNEFTCYTKGTADAFRFRVYGVSDHVWGEPAETLAPTCETAGSANEACVLCGITEPVELPALGHTLCKTEAVQPTATSEGNTEYWTCTRCGAQFYDAEGTQKVDAVGGAGGAAIGGGYKCDSGPITISGGIVRAKACVSYGNDPGAAIGGGFFGKNGPITITGGEVTAETTNPRKPWAEYISWSNHRNLAAAIGSGGNKDQGDKITISGGTVTAISHGVGAGIGGAADGGEIEIGGDDTVVVASSICGAGIGCGGEFPGVSGWQGEGFNGGSITINGGMVYGVSTYGGAGIGTGVNEHGGSITVNGGIVTGCGGADHYSWFDETNRSGKIVGVISGGMGGGPFNVIFRNAKGMIEDLIIDWIFSRDYIGAGIGGGCLGDGGRIRINGGTVIAKGGSNAVGAIGNGQDCDKAVDLQIYDYSAVSYGNYHGSDVQLEGCTHNPPNTDRVDKVKQNTYAAIEPDDVPITFDMGGHGAAPAAQTVLRGETVTRSADPAADGWFFDGWYTDGKVLLEVTGVSAENMDKTITVTINGMEEGHNSIIFNGNAFAKAMAKSADPAQQNLGAALFNYGAAANVCWRTGA